MHFLFFWRGGASRALFFGGISFGKQWVFLRLFTRGFSASAVSRLGQKKGGRGGNSYIITPCVHFPDKRIEAKKYLFLKLTARLSVSPICGGLLGSGGGAHPRRHNVTKIRGRKLHFSPSSPSPFPPASGCGLSEAGFPNGHFWARER